MFAEDSKQLLGIYIDVKFFDCFNELMEVLHRYEYIISQDLVISIEHFKSVKQIVNHLQRIKGHTFMESKGTDLENNQYALICVRERLYHDFMFGLDYMAMVCNPKKYNINEWNRVSRVIMQVLHYYALLFSRVVREMNKDKKKYKYKEKDKQEVDIYGLFRPNTGQTTRKDRGL